jgi:pimeloyl-ACP methyl ester carboxylesterase
MNNLKTKCIRRFRRVSSLLVACLMTLVCLGNAETKHQPISEIGTLVGAQYRIDVPPDWNGILVLYCHGYMSGPKQFHAGDPSDGDLYVKQRYAVAQSGFSTGGWAIREGLQDTEELRKYFSKKYGVPRATYVAGDSMGGYLAAALIEAYPETYAGGLALCPPLGSAEWFMARRVFDFRVVFDYYFPDVFPSPAKTPQDYSPPPDLEDQLGRLLKENPSKGEALVRFAGVRNVDEVGWLAEFFTSILADLDAKASGNPFDNRNVVYEGWTDADALNKGVHRYAADPKASAYLRDYYTFSGHIRKPLLALRNAYDPLVPAWVSNAYLTTLDQAGGSDLFVNQLVSRPGHCAINAEETVQAFNQLVDWASGGPRPTPGVLPTEAAKGASP